MLKVEGPSKTRGKLVSLQKGSKKDSLWNELKKDKEVVFLLRFIERYGLREQALRILAERRAVLRPN